MVAGAVAIVLILVTTLVLNPFGGSESKESVPSTEVTPASVENSQERDTTGEGQEQPEEKEDANRPNIQVSQATIAEIIKPEVEGDCELYRHVANDRYACFGTAGNFSNIATNEYRKSDSDEYFCKPTKYGCRLYETVDFQLG